MIRTESTDSRYATRVHSASHVLEADAPIAKGGGGEGFGAHELLEASLAACLNMAVRMCADANSIPLRAVATTVSLIRPDEHVVRFEYSVELTGDLTAEQRVTLQAAALSCPVRQTLTKSLEFRSV